MLSRVLSWTASTRIGDPLWLLFGALLLWTLIPAFILSRIFLAPYLSMSTQHPNSRRYHFLPVRPSPRSSPQATSQDLDYSLQEPSRQRLAWEPPRGMLDKRSDAHEAQRAARARIASLNPPTDMRLLDYVSTCDENLICPICRCPFVDPILLDACDHCFCKDCLHKTWQTRQYHPTIPTGNCPTCRTTSGMYGNTSISKILLNILDELVVQCPRHEEGCTAQLKRGEVYDHVNIYCGYTWIDCPSGSCQEPIRRKDARECMHYGVSCFDCHQTMTMASLESHWTVECEDRKVQCSRCRLPIFYREIESHASDSCPAITVSCPGAAIGCVFSTRRGLIQQHIERCTFAALAPFLQDQDRRIAEQEEKTALLTRKLQVLEGGFQSLRNLLDGDKAGDLNIGTDVALNGPSRDSRLTEPVGPTEWSSITHADDLDWPLPAPPRPMSQGVPAASQARNYSTPSSPRSRSVPPRRRSAPQAPPLPETGATALEFIDFDLPPIRAGSQIALRPDLQQRNHFSHQASSFPRMPDSTQQDNPYSSPLHHLLSLHENLREEVTRVTTALHELDGRHSMLILNENLRLKEDMAYLGGQIGGLNRQVGWLTSARLQENQSHSHGGGRGGGVGVALGSSTGARTGDTSETVDMGDVAVAGPSNATGGAGAGFRGSMGMGRRTTDEGRTKL